MILDPIKVAVAMADGLSAACSSCVRYWSEADRGFPLGKCGAKGKCGSPIAGDNFSEYEGPLKGYLHEWCFVCGKRSDFGISVNGRPQMVGACAAHIHYLEKYVPVGGSAAKFEVKSATGRPDGLGLPHKPSLIEMIIQTEQEWAKSG